MWEQRPLESIEETDLLGLVTDEVPEGLRIEYKSERLGPTPLERKEFLADVASFANAVGGHLIFGIEEDGGVPTRVGGLVLTDRDAEVLRLDNLIRDGLDPRVPGIHIRAVSVSGGNAAITIRIPASPRAPHMVIYQGEDRFSTRNSAGKSRMKISLTRLAGRSSSSGPGM